MQGTRRKLKDKSGNDIFPVTSASAVYMPDGVTTVDVELNDAAKQSDLDVQKYRIDSLVSTPNSSFYEKTTNGTTGALLVVSSGATTGQINLSAVTPTATGYTPVAGDYVRLVYGVASGSSELIDLRTDSEGLIHNNVGNAVRYQTSKLKSKIDNIESQLLIYHMPKNIFNKNATLTEGQLTTSGGNTGSAAYWSTDFIEVIPSAHIYSSRISTGTTRVKWDLTSLLFYTADKILISGGYVQSGSFDVPANCKYIKISFDKTYLSLDLQIEYGTSMTSYESYYTPYYEVKNTNVQPSDSGKIACIGDSLTYGSGSTNNNGYPYTLSNLTGKICNKLAFPSDTSREIVGYVGGMPILVKEGVTIPTTGSVTIQLIDYNGNGVSFGYQTIAAPNINPVTIAGVKGNLTLNLSGNDTSNSNSYVFTRSVNGNAIDINYPTPLVTNCSVANARDIFIICIGQNGGYDNIDEYIKQVDLIVKHQGITDKKYIVVGIPAQSQSALQDLEKSLLLKYGRNFINMRDYLVKRGLQDTGITPTSQDNSDIAIGKPPTSLRSDAVHLNDAGYQVMATQIYKRGQELGYW